LQFLIHLLPVSSGFHFYTHAFRSLLRVFYALPTVHDTSSKNAKLSSATTSFPWHHTNISKNHGYNAVADDLRRQPFRAEDSAPAPYEEGQKGRKGQTFSDHTYPTVSSRPRGRCVQSLVQIGSEMWICIGYKQTNKQTFSFIYKMCTHDMLSSVVGTATGTITQHDAEHARENTACHLIQRKQIHCNSAVQFLLYVQDRSSFWIGNLVSEHHC